MNDGIARWWSSGPVRWMYSITLTVACLALLMVLVFWGTLYQIEHGLYAAQEKFFSSWLVWVLGVIPFPGGKLVLGALLVNLLGYMVNMLIFQPLKPGILLIHSGLLVMLIGGAITHYHGEEGYLSLWEGESSNVASSYVEWELAVWKRSGAVREVYAITADGLEAGETLAFSPLPIEIEVERWFDNARGFRSDAITPPFLSSFNITRVEEAPPEKEPPQNVAAGIFRISAPDMETASVLLFGDDIAPLVIPVGEEEYVVGLRHKRIPMPLVIRLLDFRREMHPGTETPSSFSSLVEVKSDGLVRELTISMNKPLRHHGFTLYQQSYRIDPDGRESSTFAVTRNAGRLLPYVSTAMVVLGMIVHFVVMLIRHARRRVAPSRASS